jgi:hypothetical protein
MTYNFLLRRVPNNGMIWKDRDADVLDVSCRRRNHCSCLRYYRKTAKGDRAADKELPTEQTQA